MGFGKALNIQNQLQTGTKRLEEKSEKSKRDRDDLCKEYRKASGEEPEDIRSFIKTLSIVLKFNKRK